MIGNGSPGILAPDHVNQQRAAQQMQHQAEMSLRVARLKCAESVLCQMAAHCNVQAEPKQLAEFAYECAVELYEVAGVIVKAPPQNPGIVQ